MSDEMYFEPEPAPSFDRIPGADGARAWKALDTARAQNKLDMTSWFNAGNEYNPFTVSLDLTELLAAEPGCGTTACLAGWIVAQAGCSMIHGGAIEDHETQVYDKNGERLGSVPVVAADLLGIPRRIAYALFTDTVESSLDTALTQIFGPRPEPSQGNESGEVTA